MLAEAGHAGGHKIGFQGTHVGLAIVEERARTPEDILCHNAHGGRVDRGAEGTRNHPGPQANRQQQDQPDGNTFTDADAAGQHGVGIVANQKTISVEGRMSVRVTPMKFMPGATDTG